MKEKIKTWMVAYFVLILILTFVCVASAQKIYVSNNCEGISSCYSNLPHAISFANDNDRIIVKSGEHFVDSLIIEKDITIEGEDRDATFLYPSSETTCCTGDSQAWFLIKERVIFDISNLTFDGKGKRISQAIRSFGTGKIYNNLFRNISWSDNQGAAIVAFGGNTTIDSNSFSGIGRNSIWAGSYYAEEYFGVNIPVIGNNYQIINNILEGKGECDCIDKGIEIGVKTLGTKISGNEIFNYLGRYSAESSYSMGISAWNTIGETLGIDISNNSIHNCIIPIYLKNQGSANNQIKISKNNMQDNEFDGLNMNYNQDSVINFEGIGSNDKISGEISNFSLKQDYLFDIKLEIQDKNIKSQESLNAVLRFESFGTKPTPAHINYVILNEYNQEVYSETEDIVVETEQTVTKKFENLNLAGGEYILNARVDYSDVTDSFKQGFSVEENPGKVNTSFWIPNSKGDAYLFFIFGVLAMGVLLAVYLRYQKNSGKKESSEEKDDIPKKVNGKDNGLEKGRRKR